MLEYVLPGEIEKRSFEIIGEELATRGIVLPDDQTPVTMRVIHTSADFDYAETMCYSQDAVEKAKSLICAGADIVTDTNMALAGINKKALAKHGGQAYCFMADEAVAAEAKERPHYRPTEVARLCEEDGEFNLLVSVVVPAYLDRSMTHRDNEIFAWLHHDMKIPVDVLEYCVEQCVERKREDKAKPQFMHYIETVALRWHEEGVRDLEGARAAVRRFDEKVRLQKEGAARVQEAAQAPEEGAAKGRRKSGPGRSAKIQALYGFSTERGRDEVDYNALAWSRMWEEK